MLNIFNDIPQDLPQTGNGILSFDFPFFFVIIQSDSSAL